jgi:hypothetical protein
VYSFLRSAHFWLGWLSAVLVITWSVRARLPRLPGVPSETTLRWSASACLAGQLVIALLLHLRYSAFTAGVRANLVVVLRDPTLRYWNVLHPALGMITVAWWLWRLNGMRAGAPYIDALATAAVLAMILSAVMSA